MRKLKLIGIGAGNPDYITVQAINALKQVDVVFVTDKGQETADLLRARHEVCERYMQARPYRTVELQDPKRDRATDEYLAAVAAWHEARTALYEQGIRDHLSDGECGAFLVWGDPSLYDSTLRILDAVAAEIDIDYDVIPGITAVQALTARHRIPLNEVGEPVLITTGRQLRAHGLSGSAVVMLDAECSFRTCPANTRIWWGAYLGTDDELLVAGAVGEVGARIVALRAEARARHGWIMDTYLLRAV